MIEIESDKRKPKRKLFKPEIAALDDENHEIVESFKTVMPSPTKEELKQMNKKLQQKVKEFEMTKCKKTEKKGAVNLNFEQFLQPKLVKCSQPNCEKEFGRTNIDQQNLFKKVLVRWIFSSSRALKSPLC